MNTIEFVNVRSGVERKVGPFTYVQLTYEVLRVGVAAVDEADRELELAVYENNLWTLLSDKTTWTDIIIT